MTADTALAIILNDTNMVWSSSQCLKLKATSNLFALSSFRRQLLTRKSFLSEIYSAIYVLYLIPVCNQWSMVWKYNYTVYSIKICKSDFFSQNKQHLPTEIFWAQPDRVCCRLKRLSDQSYFKPRAITISQNRPIGWYVSVLPNWYSCLCTSWAMSVWPETSISSTELSRTGAHQIKPPSPIQAIGVNPFPSKFINRTVPCGGFARWWRREPMKIEKWQ